MSEIDAINAYCVKCKQERPMIHAHIETNPETGRRIAKGECGTCRGKTNRFLPSVKAAAKA